MPHPSRAHLDAIGIPVWVRRTEANAARHVDVPAATTGPEAAAILAAVAEHGDVPTATAGPEAAAAPAARALEAIDAQVRACRQCALHQTRTRTVFGAGSPSAACMFIGEAPGAEEDRRGEPFVGRAGVLLDAMLAAIGLKREEVYIANIVKCRPPRNRAPHADEIVACSAYLRRQIEAISPRLLVAVGRVAAQSLLSTTKPIGRLRGHVHHHAGDGLPVLVTYHPAYLLRSPLEKRKVWDDLVRLRSMLAGDAAPVP